MRETTQAHLTAFQNFLIVGSAASLARASVNGLSVLKIRDQVGVPGYKMGPIKALTTTWRLERFGGFFKGLNAAVIRSFLHVGIQFTVFDQLAKQFVPDEWGNKVSTIETYVTAINICGGTAGMVATLCTHPFDLVNTRLVVQGKGDPLNYKGILDCFAKIIKFDGFTGLYRGLIPSLMGSFLVSGNLFFYWNFFRILKRDGAFVRSELSFLLWVTVITTTGVVSYPYDLWRHKMMAFDTGLPKNGRVDIPADRLLQTLANIHMSSGLLGHFCGFITNMLKLVPQLVGFWLTYHILEKAMLSKKKGYFTE